MKNLITLILIALLCNSASAQKHYTQDKFTYDSLLNIVYGTATDYAGNIDTLRMDIFKPKGDSNCLRPVMVLVHGGAWIAGSKEDANMAFMARSLARKGWVVANINYRLGTHKASNYSMYALCNAELSAPCGYISDSSEIYRANFRGMQDAKDAIKFMKARNAIDSSDIDNVFICGESAGGFVAMAVAFTDKNSEKHSACFSMPDAPSPDNDLKTYACIPDSNDLSRPDLGSIDGNSNIVDYDATVKGVANFYGGVLNPSILHQDKDTPHVYMFHQGSDVVVNYRRGALLGRVSWECFASANFCQPYYFYPIAYGSESIRKFFVDSGFIGSRFKAEIIGNYSFNNNCFSNGHSIDNINNRIGSMLSHFSDCISESGNDAKENCNDVSIDGIEISNIRILPNPFHNSFQIISEDIGSKYVILDVYGRTILEGTITQNSSKIDLNEFENGYFTILVYNEKLNTFKILKY